MQKNTNHISYQTLKGLLNVLIERPYISWPLSEIKLDQKVWIEDVHLQYKLSIAQHVVVYKKFQGFVCCPSLEGALVNDFNSF